MPYDLLIRNTSEVVTCSGPPLGSVEASLHTLPHAVVGITDGKIAFLGPPDGVSPDTVSTTTKIIDANGGFVGPGFVDAHTHVVFAGDRAQEFEQRMSGASYAEIAAGGGGIQRTVLSTRAASVDLLTRAALPRLARLLSFGVTTAEIKSGYGLSLESELRILQAIEQLGTLQPVRLIPTLLCAHAVPEEHQHSREAYVRHCIEDIIPAVAQAQLARFCDVFVENGAFTLEEGRRVLIAAASYGLALRVHADQLSASGGALLAAELHAASADHLENITEEGARALAAAGVVATLVPTSTLFLKLASYAPGRLLRDHGVTIGLGTNVNPGSAMSENHALSLGLSCLGNGLTPSEAYLAATRGAAESLKLPEAGRLSVGGPADLVVFTCPSHRHLPYHLAMNQVSTVIKNGRAVYSDGPVPDPD